MPQSLALQTKSHVLAWKDDQLRHLSRSPKPYHRQHSELPYGSERLHPALGIAQDSAASPRKGAASTNSDDSGTEADDEHFLKGLPAPRLRLHKGLRGWDLSSPLPSPALDDDLHTPREPSRLARELDKDDTPRRNALQRWRQKRRSELQRRVVEAALLGVVCAIVGRDARARGALQVWGTGEGACVANPRRADI